MRRRATAAGASTAKSLSKSKSKSKSRSKSRSPLLVTPPSDARRRLSSASPLAATTVSTVGDLRGLASSSLDSLKRRLDLCHSDALKDFDASLSRISKRFKIQTQACLQLTDEVEKEYKKMSDRIKESAELITTSYKEIIAEAHSSTSRACKVTIPEMAKSVEKSIGSLCTRYKIPQTPI